MLHSRSATPAFRVIRVFRGSKSQSEPFDITSLRSRVPPHLCVLCVLCGENPSGIQRSTTRSRIAAIRAYSRSIALNRAQSRLLKASKKMSPHDLVPLCHRISSVFRFALYRVLPAALQLQRLSFLLLLSTISDPPSTVHSGPALPSDLTKRGRSLPCRRRFRIWRLGSTTPSSSHFYDGDD